MDKKLRTGDIVRIVAGHDSGRFMIVAKVDEDRLVVLDGKTRTVEKQKKKNIAHVRAIGRACEQLIYLIENEKVENHELRKELKRFSDEQNRR